jgi:RNA polymerase sigma factor (sigma-70 family)
MTDAKRELSNVTSRKHSLLSDDLEALFGVGAVGRVSDGELLVRLFDRSDAAASEAAFSALVARHGPMVLGVCRRMLGDEHIAADAFQAVFLVLARKAGSVRVDDSIGRWLYGVSVRVARRARAISFAERSRARSLDGFDRADPAAPSDVCEQAERRTVIDEEIARLPDRYRMAVVLCYIEGLTQEQAARRLRCPVGTVQSRLHRARERLRSRLSRRGVAPMAGFLTWLSTESAQACVPSRLSAETTAIVVRLRQGNVLGEMVLSRVLVLLQGTIRSMTMTQGWRIGLILLAAVVPVAGAVKLAGGDDGQSKVTARPVAAPKAATKDTRSEPSIAERFAKIRAEYDAQLQAVSRAVEASKTQREINATYTKMSPDEVAFTRRMIDLATSAPKDPAARDALIWVINKPGMKDVGPYGAEFARAASLLILYHGDDPDAVSAALGLDNLMSFNRDALLLGFYAAAKCHDAKGLARLALAQYLEQKARFAKGVGRGQDRKKVRYHGFIDDDGKSYDKVMDQSDEEYAYQVGLGQCDPDHLKAEAERLYKEVVALYADVRHRTVKTRELEALFREPEPRWNGKLLTADERRQLADLVARKKTLGDEASARLDEMQNLIVGKPAPEIDGVDFDGKPLKLSDYRGKVVVLVFWGTWCGPCMSEVPHERALAERLKGRPFAMLGVNCDDNKQAAVDAIKSERITWPNWHDGAPGDGPIAKRYHIHGYPSVFVIDEQGIIRQTQTYLLGDVLDKAIDDLLARRTR